MNWLFWVLLLGGFVLVVWPLFTGISTIITLFSWLLGALAIITAFFVLPAGWARRDELTPAPARVPRRRRGPPS